MGSEIDYPDFSQQWENYTTNEKILYVCSFLIFLIVAAYFVFNFPVIDEAVVDNDFGDVLGIEGCTDYLTDWKNPNYDDEVFCRITAIYIIPPLFQLILTILLTAYAIILFTRNENTEVHLADNKLPSASYMTEKWIMISLGCVGFVFLYVLLFGVMLESEGEYRGSNPVIEDILAGTRYQMSEDDMEYYQDKTYYEGTGSEYTGSWVDNPSSVSPLSYLYIPNLIAIFALVILTRRKNDEENEKFIEDFGRWDGPGLYDELEPEPEQIRVKKPPRDPDEEMKNTCNRCGKVWFLDADELDDLEERLGTANEAMGQMGGLTMLSALFNPALAAQSTTTMAANTGALKSLADELNEKSRCPECKSKSIEREIVGAGTTVSKKVVKKIEAEEGSLVDELKKLNELKEQGILDDEEFKSAKKKLIDKFS